MARQGLVAIVLDTSVLLNFVNIGRLELLGQLDTSVVLPDRVLDEIRRPAQRQAVEDAVMAGILDLQSIRNPTEVALFTDIRAGGRLGAGECAVLAVTLAWQQNSEGQGLFTVVEKNVNGRDVRQQLEDFFDGQ